MIFKSIKWRLQLWYGLILVAVLAGFGVAAFQLERGRVLRRIDGELRLRVTTLANVLRDQLGEGRGQGPRREGWAGPGRPPRDQQHPPEDGPPNGEGFRRGPQEPPNDFHLPTHVTGLFEESDKNAFYYILTWRDGREVARSTNAPSGRAAEWVSKNAPLVQVNEPPKLPVPPSDYDGPLRLDKEEPGRRAANEAGAPWMRGNFREIQLITPPGERLLVGRNIAGELSELRLVAVKLAAIGGGVLLLGLAVGAWLITRAIRPIGEISSAAAKISSGDLSQRINASETESELGQLATVLNTTFGRLDAAFARQQQFTSDAAHELRTPVSVILTQTQGTLHKERSGPEYRETLEACQRAAQRMRRLIESLLELARLDASQASNKREPLDLSRCVADCIELVRPLAEERRIALHSELASAPCPGDADQLALVITNLLSNAIHYNRDGGEVRITTRQECSSALVIVSDNGLGIAAEHLPHIFDRFYRADAARTSSQGRTGLGLAITKAIVEAHGGTIEVTSEPDKGSSFTVRLPA